MTRNLLISTSILIVITFYACDVLQEVVKETTNINTEGLFNSNLWNRFNKATPISTTFEDAVFEAKYLYDFEPSLLEYRPLENQPKASTGGFILRSGLYSMDAKSFCLRGYTHGPSRGDGHLYAPLKGKKSDLVQSIIEKYSEKPGVDQKNVQVLLWAIIAGADMNSLGEQHSKTLNELFTIQELLKFQGKDMLSGFADNQLTKLKQLAFNNPQLRNLLEADNRIRNMVQQNRSFLEIERVAILAGTAPRENMIREVSKGRWSYHPDGFFIRFFPNGYPQTRVDVYVPHEGDLSFDAAGNPRIIKNESPVVKEVIYNPAIMTAVPANQSSQRIGVSGVPTESKDKYEIKFYAYNMGKEYKGKNGEDKKSLSGHIYVGYLKNGELDQVRGFSPELWENIFDNKPGKVDEFTDESHLVEFADDWFKVSVTKEQYYNALAIRKEGYLLIFDDCVSYADDVADSIGLLTPVFVLTPRDFLYPMKYLKYLRDNN